MNFKLYSSFHLPYSVIPNKNWIIPIHGGKELSNKNLNMVGDNSGTHISSRNSIYSEMTVAYWVWKNEIKKTHDYWGLIHYRRFIVPQTIFTRLGGRKSLKIKLSENISEKYFTERLRKKIVKDLSECDIILPKRCRIHSKKEDLTVKQHYIQYHIEEHWDEMLKVISEKYPDYSSSFHIFDLTTLHICNIMIAPNHIWDNYLSWLFDVLFELENRITIPNDTYQKRSLSFMCERLLNLYVYHNKLKIKEYVLVNIR